MVRRLFALVSAASLALCVATVAVWVRSCRHVTTVSRTDVTTPGGSRPDWTSTRFRTGWGQLSVEHVVTRADPTEQVRGVRPTGSGGWVVRQVAIRPDWRQPPVGTGTVWNRIGFGRSELRGVVTVNGATPSGYSQAATRYEVPLWAAALVTAAPPVGVLVPRARRSRRRRRGLCSACGYDLRATPVKGGALLDRCPECGSAARQPA